MVTAKFPAALVSLADLLGVVVNFPEAVLSGAHNASVTTIMLTATVPTSWPTAGAVVIDSEIIQYTGKSGSTLTGATRGAQSTTAASHNDTSKVIPSLTALTVNQALAEIIAIETYALGGINPNLLPNSDFGRRTVFGLAMPEVFADLSGTTKIDGSAAGSVAGNIFTQGAANNEYAWAAGSFVWRDFRASATFKAVATAGAYQLRQRIDATNYITVRSDGSGNFVLSKVVSGVTTDLGTVAQALTLNRWYWFDLESQGTTFIGKMYDTGGTASGVTKASSTLLQTLTGTASDSALAVGRHVSIFSNQANAQWGGIAASPGGVYVEANNNAPESLVDTFGGTLGGLANGIDEAADSGPLGKQWAAITYVPAASRTATRDFTIPFLPFSTAVTFSHYIKISGLGGSGVMVRVSLIEKNSAGATTATTNLDDLGTESTWTRKAATVTTQPTTTNAVLRISINPSSTRTGTVRYTCFQLEQGSAATAWRNAAADDTDLKWLQTFVAAAAYTTTSATLVEVDSRNFAIDIFLPWDADVDMDAFLEWWNTAAGNISEFDYTVDGISVTPSGALRIVKVQAATAGTNQPMVVSWSTRLASGKHRIALRWNASAGTSSINAAGSVSYLRVTATRGR